MDPDEVVMSKVQSHSRFQVAQFLAESVRQSGKAPHLHRQILPFHKGRRRDAQVRIAGDIRLFDFHDFGRRVSTGTNRFRFVEFYDLGVVHFGAEGLSHGIHINVETV